MGRYSVLPPSMLSSGHVVVSLSGEVDIAAVGAVTAALAEAIRQARTGVIVDLADLEFIDASGLGALVRARQHSRHLPAGLGLAAAPGHVMRLLRVSRLAGHLMVFPSVAVAAEAMR